ncbi:uncharacterized protein K02A2.6-like [Nematostella vectensis]|uniref:uncharacterized protein K02A2.6-like n=1 Tax=Nematostella vectensis TaxID=45351 RepID=UPI0020777AC2|nr:uncharacterized protein K02A2.6-like [Nematostella vectensis]
MSLSDSSPTSDPVSAFPDVFTGEGKLDQKLHLELDATVPPVILPVRKVPLALTNAKVFSVVDAKNGFWHIQLDDESSFLTTFGTPWGRYRWTRMPFGIAPAPEEFQRRLEQALEGLEGVKPIFDDILILGKGDSKEEAIRDHDAKLRSLLERCRQKSIKLNKEKLKLRCAEVKFIGHVVSADGLKPDPDKLQGIEEMPTPTNKQDIKRLLVMANYLQKFAPNLSEAAAPMREVLREENQFHWDEQVQGQSFKNVKKIVSQAPVLKFFDPHEEVELQCDASEKGMGACLMQKGQPVAYASRSLTETEKNYAQIDKEMLSIVFGVERFEHYLYGRPIKVETDHKPLESIFKKSIISAPKRLQRMMLRLQKFDLQVNYKRGAEMYLADTLSRAFRGQKRSASRDDVGDVMLLEEMRGTTEREVESIDMIQFLPVSEATQASLRQATEQDTAMRELKSIIRQGWPEVKDDVPVSIRDYYSFRDELSLQNGLVFKGERLVIPNSSRVEMLAKIHASHIGIQGCLRRAREVLYWPGINKEVEEYFAKCEICNSHLSEQGKEPIICHEIPNRPWEKVGIDLFELNGKDFVLTVDYYSGFFEVDRLEGKTAKEVIRKIKPHVARHGIPDQIMSDNGPPFDSHEFRQFTNSYRIEHVTSSPGYAQSNGKVENAINTAKNLMKKATESNKDPYLALLDWRNTPSETVGYSPVQRLFNRRTKTLLPTSSRLLKPSVPRDVRQKLTLQKARQSLNYNRGAKELEELKQGDVVRLQPTKTVGRAKQWKQARVEGKLDIRSYQVRTEDGRVYRRNRRHLRKTREQMQPPQQEEIEMHCPYPSRPAKPAMPTKHKQQQQEKQPSEKAPENTAQDVPDVPAEQRTRSGRVVKPPLTRQRSISESEELSVSSSFDSESELLESQPELLDNEFHGYDESLDPVPNGEEAAEYEQQLHEENEQEEELLRRFSREQDISTWFKCSNCSLKLLVTKQECRCCTEFATCSEKLQEVGLEGCIVDHPGFSVNCLNEWVLRTAAVGLKTRKKKSYTSVKSAKNASESEFLRSVAYRQYVRLVYECVGWSKRASLPSCVYNKIREAFPSETFHGFEEDKEDANSEDMEFE